MSLHQLLLSQPMLTGYACLLVLLGATWRRWDGMDHTGWQAKGGIRVFFGSTIALCAAWVGLLPSTGLDWHVVPLVVSGAMIALTKSFSGDDWVEWWPQVVTYWPASIGVGVWGVYSGAHMEAMLYILATLGAGLSYPLGAYLQRYRKFNYTEYAELISGGVVIGGLAFL